ncbi:hypothetical protein SteCoe_13620 [Stentor coeruleus]|uniref:Calponin-homology (CH) domain-containing protein n=1 Tax=Stentor coeruleus TaxID=5963 RepID=A0A1R2C811_9CILI|nr:hypothetical protein SteCoe_13620 [Stentor coeruleus]
MSGIPREVLKWMQGLDLSYSIKNPKRDLANGFLIGEIFSRYYPEIKMHSFDNSSELQRKLSNWEHLERMFTKLSIPLGKKYWEPVMHNAPDAAIEYIKMVYSFLTKRQLTIAPPHENPKPPPYARPTAANLLRDTEFQRIQDKKTQEGQAYKILNKHNENIRLERTEPGRLAVPSYTMRTQGSNKKIEQAEEQKDIEVRQVAVRAMDKNMRAAKALSLNKTEPKTESKIEANHTMVKPALEIMSETFLEIMHQMAYKTVRAMDFRDVEHGEEMTKKFYEIMGTINQDFVMACFENLVKRSAVLADSLVKSAQECEAYAELLFSTIEKIRIDAEHYLSFVKSIKAIGDSMTNLDSSVSRQLFSHFMLTPIVKTTLKSPEKLPILVTLVHSASHSNFSNRLHLVKEVFEASGDNNFLIKVISELLEYDTSFNKELHEYYIYYALLGLLSPSPRVQASAVCALGSIASLNPAVIIKELPKVEILLTSNWWETRAQLLRLAGILLPHKSSQQGLLEKIIKANFKPTASKNIIRIGLVYLAPCLASNPELCDLYIRCLIHIDPDIRETVLSTDIMSKGNVVKGLFTQKYLLSGAPAMWNAYGVASSLSKFIMDKGLVNLEYCHVEILWACLYKPPTNPQWVEVFEELKNYLFVGLEDPEICKGVIGVLKHFMTAPALMTEILKQSLPTMIKELSLLLANTNDKNVLSQTYEFIKSIYWGYHSAELQDFIYKVLKNFAEKYPVLFERSELVEIMNEIIRNRRGDIFEEKPESPNLRNYDD